MTTTVSWAGLAVSLLLVGVALTLVISPGPADRGGHGLASSVGAPVRWPSRSW